MVAGESKRMKVVGRRGTSCAGPGASTRNWISWAWIFRDRGRHLGAAARSPWGGGGWWWAAGLAGALAALGAGPAAARPAAIALTPRIVAQDLEAHLEQLVAGGPQAAQAWRALVREGDVAARMALARLDATSLPDDGARQRLAALVRAAGGTRSISAACGLLEDPDPEVRRYLLEFLARPDHGLAQLEARVAGMARRAALDPVGARRRQALSALGEIDDPSAVDALIALTRELPPPERAWAAAALRPTPRARDAVRALVRAGFESPPGAQRTPDDVLAEVLPLHGRLMADEAGGGESSRDRAPLVLGLRHPSAQVRAAAGRAFERLLGRLRELGEIERAARMLGGLAEQGLDPRVVHFHRARLAFYPGADPAAARVAAREMRTAGGGNPAGEDLFQRVLWRFRSLYLEGMAELALGNLPQAEALLEQGGRSLDGVLAERLDLEADDESRIQHVDALHQRALVEIALALVRLAARPGADRDVVPGLHRAHRLALEAQRGYARVAGEAFATWDNLLDHELSPLRLVFTSLELPGFSIDQGLDLQARLGRGLASVAPLEMPGFDPWPGLPPEVTDPLVDPRRRALLEDVFAARLEKVEEELDQLRARFLRRQVDSPGVLPDPDDELDLQRAMRMRMRLVETLARIGQEPGELLEQRVPSALALWLARDLRAEGRAAEGRRYAEASRADLEKAGTYLGYFWGLERMAQIEMAIGSSHTDEGEPRRAERELLQAVERLEGIEQRLTELGASRPQIASIEAIRSTALVSLAVNANVKLRDPARALEYYERAYELRQDDFMRVLLACYRARMGRAEEARALLREIHPHPQLYYNMACTYALLGESERALDYLEKELTENLGSRAARERQKVWAQDDPDLASLTGDPRFEHLVGER